MAEVLTQENLDLIKKARRILEEQWPALESHQPSDELCAEAAVLGNAFASDEFYDRMEAIRLATTKLGDEYAVLYRRVYKQRSSSYARAIDEIKGLPEWAEVFPEKESDKTKQASILAPWPPRFLAPIPNSTPALTPTIRRTTILSPRPVMSPTFRTTRPYAACPGPRSRKWSLILPPRARSRLRCFADSRKWRRPSNGSFGFG